jgi:hypothetical protein
VARPAYECFPRPPGDNPYRVKGTAYRGHNEYVAEHVPGGTAAMIAAFEDPALREFFAQPFLAATFYDVYPLAAAGHVCAALTDVSFAEFLRVRTRYQAERDARGIYKVLLKLTSAESVAMRLPRLIAQYFDFGTAEAHVIQPRFISGERGGTPRPLAEWYSLVQENYLVTVLELAGAKNVFVRTHRPRVTERIDGVDIVSFRADVKWDE